MTLRLKSFQWLAAVAVVLPSLAATAAVKPNPYGKIHERNVFNLQQMPATPSQEIPQKIRRLPPNVSITGLVQFGRVSKALVEVTEPGQPVQRSILAAGGHVGDLEVLDVDVPRERVRVRIDGDEETLSMKKPKPEALAPPLPPAPLPPRRGTVLRG